MLSDSLTAILLGSLLGLRHATDADHVVAVSAIVAREGSLALAARVGALWGIGHAATLVVVGGAMVAFRFVIPPRVGLGLEFGVALMLILLGYANLRRRDDAGSGKEPVRRPLLIGVVHGLAGSAAVALLVLATIRSTFAALAYLLVFGLGTVAGMVAVTVLLAAPALYAGNRGPHVQSGIRVVAGTLSIAFGLLLVRELVVGGLFSAAPIWTPH